MIAHFASVGQDFFYSQYLAVIEYGDLEKTIEKTRIFAEAIGGFGRMNARKYKASVVADKLLEVLE